jgi:hypothetical protein
MVAVLCASVHVIAELFVVKDKLHPVGLLVITVAMVLAKLKELALPGVRDPMLPVPVTFRVRESSVHFAYRVIVVPGTK